MTSSTLDYNPPVTWEQLQEQTRIYYVGDSTNAAGGGLIIKRDSIDPKWGYRQVKIEMDDGREWRSIDLAAFQPGPGRRFWLETDWHERRRQAIAMLSHPRGVVSTAPCECEQDKEAVPAGNSASIGVRELATILAALRLHQRLPLESREPENEIATDGGEFDALSLAEIDALCERLNAKPVRRSYYEAKDTARPVKTAQPVVQVTPVVPVESAPPTEPETKFRAVVVGDIFVSSWGYDQTNIDFYEVVRLTKKQVCIRPIRAEADGDGWTGKKMPVKGTFTGEASRHAVKHSGNLYSEDEPYLKVEGHYARLWDGKPRSFTAYA
jgi:hypothetical protein